MDVLILLPTYNEEENIGTIIDLIRAVSNKWRILIVDGGSRDNTVKIAKMKGAEVLTVSVRGKGKAVAAAFEQINEENIVLLDADLSYSPSEIPKFLEKLEKCDVVVGSRFAGTIEEEAMILIKRLGNLFLTSLGNLLYKGNATDICSGFWAFRKTAYKKMNITAPNFELEANFFTECMKKKLKLCEIPTIYKKRGGKSKISIPDGFKIALFLFSERFLN